METLGPFKGKYRGIDRDYIGVMEKKMEFVYNGLYIARNKVSTYSGLGASEEAPHAEKDYNQWAMLRSELIRCFKLILL